MDLGPVSKKIVAFGSKKVFLPKFTVALIRTPKLSPYQAKFRVPLSFSKYDLRDYLYHVYNVKVHSIRSLVKQLPVRDTREQSRHFFRPESEKYMTVEMEKPFVWPEDPESWEPWGRSQFNKSIVNTRAFYGIKSDHEQRVDVRVKRLQALNVLDSRPEEQDDTSATRWERQRTPQILSHELLPARNFASLRSPDKPSKPASRQTQP